jgi:hypothetical protein
VLASGTSDGGLSEPGSAIGGGGPWGVDGTTAGPVAVAPAGGRGVAVGGAGGAVQLGQLVAVGWAWLPR